MDNISPQFHEPQQSFLTQICYQLSSLVRCPITSYSTNSEKLVNNFFLVSNGFFVVQIDTTPILEDVLFKRDGSISPLFPLIFSGWQSFGETERKLLSETIMEFVKERVEMLPPSAEEKKGTELNTAILVLFDQPATVERIQRTLWDRMRRGHMVDVIVLGRYELESIIESADPPSKLRNIILSQIDLSLVTLYQVVGPVTEHIFSGREEELKEISLNVALKSYALIGGRQVGKSSILKLLDAGRLATKGIQSFYYQCQHIKEPIYTDFLAAISKWWLPPSDLIHQSFEDILIRLPNDRPLVFLLDEADALVYFDEKGQSPLWNELRSLSQRGRCQFVFAGERRLYQAMQLGEGPYRNFAVPITVGRLHYTAVAELVTRPMKQLGIQLTNEAEIIQRVWDATSGHPNVVQRLCNRVINLLNKRGDRLLDIMDVETVINIPDFQLKDFYQIYLLNATILEYMIVLLMAWSDHDSYSAMRVEELLNVALNRYAKVTEYPLFSSIEDALERLIDIRPILEQSRDGYRLAAHAFPFMVSRMGNIKVESLLKRLSEEFKLHGDVTKDAIAKNTPEVWDEHA